MQETSANNNAPTVDVIKFAIPGDGPHTISPTSGLPNIYDPLTIDGYSPGDSTPGILTDDAKEIRWPSAPTPY